MQFEYNYKHSNSYKIIYADFLKYYIFCKDRQKLYQSENIIGCVYYVPLISDKIYYLQLLFSAISGTISFEYLRIVEGIIYLTYKAVYLVLGLLEDDI